VVPTDLRQDVENAFGRLGYLLFYFAGGFAAMSLQTAMTLLFGSASDAQIPTLGAGGAIAAVLGAYLVLYPTSRIITFVLWFPIAIPAWVFLGLDSCTSSSWATRRCCRAPVAVVSRSSPTSAGSSSFIVCRLLVGTGRLAVEGTRFSPV
jgi:hypothetical protein